MVKIVENENSENETFNLTYGESQSLEKMIDILRVKFPDVKINHYPKDKLMPDRGTLSIAKAKRLLNYDPKWPLEEGFVKYIEWYKGLFFSDSESKEKL